MSLLAALPCSAVAYSHSSLEHGNGRPAKACVPRGSGSCLRHFSPSVTTTTSRLVRTTHNVSHTDTNVYAMLLLPRAIGPVWIAERSANSVISRCDILVGFLCSAPLHRSPTVRLRGQLVHVLCYICHSELLYPCRVR